jgi:hypothetical protein
MARWWNDSNRGKLKYSDKNLLRYHSVHHKYHKDFNYVNYTSHVSHE